VDLKSFQEPERYRRQGEALLAGLSQARRIGDRVFVPDPYGEDRGEIELESDPSEPLTRTAEKLFQRSRKARRAIEAARLRGEKLEVQRRRLEALEAESAGLASSADAERLETEMRAGGVPVGLRAEGKAARDLAKVKRPKPAGVRILVSGEGLEILIGKTGPDNDRLTFKIAAPHDFWLHTAGHAGAHVVIRNPQRLTRPPRATLEEAAVAAAWFSDARDHGLVDVHWTTRKNVRRARGASSGTVTLKRFETVRVRPALPAGLTGDGN
jgi:predicted ribosome quality control (RQC) complex YloA/Tae2 family protein